MEIKGKQEEWRVVKGFDGIYEVSNLGRVRSIDHDVLTGHNGIRAVRGRILVPNINSNGYSFIKTSSKYGNKHLSVHRLVAMAFLENPQNLPEVNHKDENKSNNNVSNLEWCDHSYNALYGTCQERLSRYKRRKVAAYDKKNGALVSTYESMQIAMEATGVHTVTISAVCRGKRKSAGGFIWRYCL